MPSARSTLPSLLMLTVLLAGCASPTPEDPEPKQREPLDCGVSERFENIDRTFAFCLPLQWDVRTNINGADVWLGAPDNPTDPFLDSVTVTRWRPPSNWTLEDYVAWHETQARLNAGIQNYTRIALVNGTGKLDTEPAWRLEYVGILPLQFGDQVVNATLYWQQIMTLHNGVAYVITYTTLESTSRSNMAPYGQVIASFRFLT